jgi:hypothetical protein
MSGNRAGRENVFAVCDVIPSEISETHMKKASISKENLPQLKEPMQVEVLLSEELLARKLAHDFFLELETFALFVPLDSEVEFVTSAHAAVVRIERCCI